MLRVIGWKLRIWQALRLDVVLRKVGFLGLIPKHLKDLEPQTPRMCAAFSDSLIEAKESSVAAPKYRVGMLTGCVQDLAFSDVNRDTVDVLLANDCEVVTPRAQHCCGSLHAHNGELELAPRTRTPPDRQLSISTASTPSSPTLAAAAPTSNNTATSCTKTPFYAGRAKVWDAKVKDIHEWLVGIDFRAPRAGAGVEAVTYHESCHLCHGQKITSQPRKILQSIPGLVFKELPESNWCCGSAGIYNITQPEQSRKLRDRKMENIAATNAPIVATSNPGCHLQIVNGGGDLRVTQPVSLLAAAYRAEVTA
jgi:glycolate oxidase iron-sulfur subunit